MQCKICGNKSTLLFKATILRKHDISYFKCEYCGFIQTEQPYWLDEAYNDAITDMDIGYVTRNLVFSKIVPSIIDKVAKKKGIFLDYGGGYGLFARLMRDLGFDFYRFDAYCENIFAKHFDFNDIAKDLNPFDFLTAFEVFEHLENPLEEIRKMLSLSKSILFSTRLQPASDIKSLDDWDYFAAESGQHISFFTKKSLEIIAARYNLHLYTNDKDLHLLTSLKMKINWVKYISIRQQLYDKVFHRHFCNRQTLIFKDVDYVKKEYNS